MLAHFWHRLNILKVSCYTEPVFAVTAQGQLRLVEELKKQQDIWRG